MYIKLAYIERRLQASVTVYVYRLGVFSGGDVRWLRSGREGLSSLSSSTHRPTATTRHAGKGKSRQRSKGTVRCSVNFTCATLCYSTVLAVGRCLSVCVCHKTLVTQTDKSKRIVSQRLNGLSCFLAERLPSTFPALYFTEILVSPK